MQERIRQETFVTKALCKSFNGPSPLQVLTTIELCYTLLSALFVCAGIVQVFVGIADAANEEKMHIVMNAGR